MEEEQFDVVIDLEEGEYESSAPFDEQSLFEELRDWFSLGEGQTCRDIQESNCYFEMIPFDQFYPEHPYLDTTLWWMSTTHPVARALYCISHEDPKYVVGDESIGECYVYKEASVKRGIAELLSFFKRHAGENENAKGETE